jgi:cytidine deaminase
MDQAHGTSPHHQLADDVTVGGGTDGDLNFADEQAAIAWLAAGNACHRLWIHSEGAELSSWLAGPGSTTGRQAVGAVVVASPDAGERGRVRGLIAGQYRVLSREDGTAERTEGTPGHDGGHDDKVRIPVDENELLAAARDASRQSHSPYSHFAVGASVQAADGTVYPGCNIENASYGLTVCAERTALFTAVAAGAGPLVALAVTCPDGDAGQPSTMMPCGACRQVMSELLADDAAIIVDSVGTFTIDDLLPGAFTL